MSKVKPAPVVGVCATCPWRREHQGKPHPAGWYRLTNIRRLWNGIRTGKAPGMVCHSTDPESATYGATKPVPETATPRECGGALFLMYRETKRLGVAANYRAYRASVKFPMSRPAFFQLLNRQVFGGISGNAPPAITIDDPDAVGFPWER